LFDVFIDGIKINQYIPYESLSDYEQLVKGDGAFDYRVETIKFDADTTLLKEFSVGELAIQDMKNKLAEVYYYDSKILYGLLKEIEINFDSDELSIGFHSLARISSDISLKDLSLIYSSPIYVYGLEKTLDQSIDIISSYIDMYLSYHNLPIRINTSQNIINVDDFSFLNSLLLTNMTIPNFRIYVNPPANTLYLQTENKHIWGIYKRQAGVLTSYPPYVLAWRSWHPTGTPAIVYANIDENGITNADYTGDMNFYSRYGTEPINQWNNDGIESMIAKSHGDDSPVWRGKAKINDKYFACMRDDSHPDYNTYYVDYVEVTEQDIFSFRFEDVNIGKILRSFATLTNSIVNIDSLGRVVMVSRDGLSGLDPTNVISASYKVTDYRDEEFEVPEEFYILDETREDLNEYFSNFFSGKILKGNFVVERDDIPASSFPLVMKTFRALIKGVEFDAGAIVKVEYQEQFLEIKTEKNLG